MKRKMGSFLPRRIEIFLHSRYRICWCEIVTTRSANVVYERAVARPTSSRIGARWEILARTGIDATGGPVRPQHRPSTLRLTFAILPPILRLAPLRPETREAGLYLSLANRTRESGITNGAPPRGTSRSRLRAPNARLTISAVSYQCHELHRSIA